MTIQEQIAAIRAALTAIESAIAQTEAALRMASTAADVMALTSTLADLRAERARLQFQLANLQAAEVEVTPLAAPVARARAAAAPRAAGGPSSAEMKAISKKLTTAVTDRTIVEATLKFATEVKDLAATVRTIGDNPRRPLPKPRKTKKK
jgi:hypothetical protein